MSASMPESVSLLSPGDLVASLRRQIAAAEQTRRTKGAETISTGCAALDQLLPHGGLMRGTLVEWLAAEAGAGETTWALRVAREAARQGGALVLLDSDGTFYPPAAAGLGIDLARLLVVQVARRADRVWVLDQALRCSAVAATLARMEKIDGRDFRRLQLAAEEGGSLGLLLRPSAARGEPSWAEVRLGIEPLPAADAQAGRRWRVHLLRCRGAAEGATLDVVLDDETNTLLLDCASARPVRRAAHTA